jgi:hypothetical protein
MQENILICSCFSSDHQIIIYKTTDSLYGPEAYMHIHLCPRPFWHRLKYAIKYVLGYNSKVGAWDEFAFHSGHVNKLQDLVNHLNTNDTNRITV